ncbi:MAG: hypothetical protein V2A64_04415 [Candidatus Omnitrophota bacterium]
MKRKTKRLKWLIYFSTFFLFVTTAEAEITVNQNYLNIEKLSEHSMDLIRNAKILFGHMSVGINTLNGLGDLASQNEKYELTITQVFSANDFNSPKLGHFFLGGNKDPIGKLSRFSDKIRNTYGQNIQIAIFKFCPLDINRDTNVATLFNTYKNTMSSLKSAYPNIIFVHSTCPLSVGDELSNIKRGQFNNWMLNEYNGKEYIFDIAAIESAYPDGRKAAFTSSGQTYYKLCPEYTTDGIHLNDPSNQGRQRAAKGMLYLLADIVQTHSLN